jgi:hypothetical protein
MNLITHCTLAVDPALRELVFRLRYACYSRKALIDPRADERFSDAFDDRVNNFSFLLGSPQGEPLASIRISIVRPDLGWTASLACTVFADHPSLAAVDAWHTALAIVATLF